MTEPLTATTTRPGYQGTPILFSPALLGKFEERLTVAEKCGYDEITFEEKNVRLTFGQALAVAVRNGFCAAYGVEFINWVVGPVPAFTENVCPNYLAAVKRITGSTFVPPATPVTTHAPPCELTTQTDEASLSDEQHEFLAHHSISFDEVYFAHNQRSKDYRAQMRAGGYRVAVGVTPCKEHGHTMRLTSGHCAQCNPQNLGFRKIYETPGYVYIAVSKSGGIVKVGGAAEVESREKSLRSHSYGGYADWRVVFSAKCAIFGRVEKMVHDLLADYRYESSYMKAGKWVDCNEIFSCDEATAERAVKNAMAQTTSC